VGRFSSELTGYQSTRRAAIEGDRVTHRRGFEEPEVIILGVVLLIIGLLFHVAIIWTLGVLAVVIGAVLALLGGVGREIGGRRHYY
jgi:uncharacterized membrane protein HdeD (DUF308 family)